MNNLILAVAWGGFAALLLVVNYHIRTSAWAKWMTWWAMWGSIALAAWSLVRLTLMSR